MMRMENDIFSGLGGYNPEPQQPQEEMATDRQLQALMHMGYKGDVTGLTKAQASQYIEELRNQKLQEQNVEEKPKMEKQTNQVVQTKKTGYEITTRNEQEITLTKEAVSQYLGVNLTDPEFSYFFSVCKNYKLNPFLKEIYAIKFGNQPATFVIDYKVLQQAVDNQPQFDGLETGILYLDKDGNEKERTGAYILPSEELIGAWCKVYRKDRKLTNKYYALYEENVKYTKDGEPNTNWATKPVFMITKVAKAQAIRETFPNMFDVNVYTDAEFDNVSEEVKANSIDAVTTEQLNSGKKKIDVND